MDLTIGIAIAAVLLGLLLLGGVGMVLLVGGGVMFFRRGKGSAASAPDGAPRRSAPSPKGARATPSREGPSPAAAPPPPRPSAGLIGFFDDEPAPAPAPSAQKPDDGAKTELFQRGKMNVDWEIDEEEAEAEATEIFSAHGAAGDLAEFAFDDEDAQGTGQIDLKHR